MPDEQGPTKHITEALGGERIAPMSNEERTEREHVRNLIQGVLTCYNALVGQETDSVRRAELEEKRAFYTEQFRRRVDLSAEERSEVLRTYPDLLSRLRAELGE